MPPPLPPGLSFPIPLSPPLLLLLPETSDLIPPFRQLLSPPLLPPIPLYHSLSYERTLCSPVAKTRKDGLSSLSFPRRTFAPSCSAWVPYIEGKLLVRHPGVQSYIAVCVCVAKNFAPEIKSNKKISLSLHKKSGKERDGEKTFPSTSSLEKRVGSRQRVPPHGLFADILPPRGRGRNPPPLRPNPKRGGEAERREEGGGHIVFLFRPSFGASNSIWRGHTHSRRLTHAKAEEGARHMRKK